MRIRIAEKQDIPAIEDLLGRSYPVLMAGAYAPDVLSQALPAMTRANPDLVASGRFYVAEAVGSIIGCGGWSRAEPGTGAVVEGLVHARHFAVDPEAIGQGVGRALFARCEAEAGLIGAVRIQTFSSLNAEAFYHRMGLRRLELIHLDMGRGVWFPVVRMEGMLDRK